MALSIPYLLSIITFLPLLGAVLVLVIPGDSAKKWLAFGVSLVIFVVSLALLLTIYQGYLREHDHGMATQNFGTWFAEQLVMLAVSLGVTALVVSLLYAVIRRAGERWWLWGTLAMLGVMCVGLVLGPVYIDPLFNTYSLRNDRTGLARAARTL